MDWHGYSAVQNALTTYLEHHGVKGQKWGVRRYQNKDGSRTKEGKEKNRLYSRSNRFSKTDSDVNAIYKSLTNEQKSLFGMSDDEIKSNIDWINDKSVHKYLNKRFVERDSKGKPASFLEIWSDGPGAGHVAVATRRDLQGLGYSKKVVDKAINWFNSPQNKSMGELRWDAFERNKASLVLAKKYGFQETDRRPFGEHNDILVFNSIKKKIDELLS